MLDINQYSYVTDPYEKQRNFSIHPLDDNGRHTYYYDPESHAKMYHDKLNPRFLRKIHEEKEGYFRLLNDERDKQRPVDNCKTQDKELENQEENIKEQVFDSTMIKAKEPKKEFVITKPKLNFAYEKPSENKPLLRSKSHKAFTLLDQKISTFGSTNFGKRVNKNIKLVSQPKSERYNMTTREISANTDFFRSNYKRKIGFESFNVPILKNYAKKLHEPVKFNEFHKKCMNSVSGGFFDKSQCLNSAIEKENARLNEIFAYQTSNGYLKQNNLPKISYIISQPKIMIRTTGIGNSKYMGLKYNPHNFSSIHKNMTKRNDNGALLLH